LIASVDATIKEDRRLLMEMIAAAHGKSEKNNFQHPALGSRPRKEVGQMGAQAAERGSKTGEDPGLFRVRRHRAPPI
jgi:hypothetical protein